MKSSILNKVKCIAIILICVIVHVYVFDSNNSLKNFSNNELVNVVIDPPQRIESYSNFLMEDQQIENTYNLESIESPCQFILQSIIVGTYRIGQCPSNLTFIDADLLDTTVYNPSITIEIEVVIQSTCQSTLNVTIKLPYFSDLITEKASNYSIDFILVNAGFNKIKSILQVDKFTNNDIYKDFVPLIKKVCLDRAQRDGRFQQIEYFKNERKERYSIFRELKEIKALINLKCKTCSTNNNCARIDISIGSVGNIFADVASTLPLQVVDKIKNAAGDALEIVKNPVTGTVKLAFKGLIDNLLALRDSGIAVRNLVDVIIKVVSGSKAPLHILFAYLKIISPIVRSPPGIIFITSKNNPISPVFDAFNNSLEKLLLPEVFDSIDNSEELKEEIVDSVTSTISEALTDDKKEFFCDPVNINTYINRCVQTQEVRTCFNLYGKICNQ